MNSSYQGGSALAYMLQKGSSGVLALGKRTRDSTDRFYAATSNNQFPSIVGDGVSNVFNQVQNYRLDIDSILSQHVRLYFDNLCYKELFFTTF